MPEYRWRPIEDISDPLYQFSDPDLISLKLEWEQLRKETSQKVLEEIIEEIKREWAIETGKIEGLYTLTKGITETLIREGIQARLIRHGSANRGAEWVAAIIQDQQSVLEGLFDFVAERRVLSLSYIKTMHQVFTRHQDTTEGRTPDGKIVDMPLIKGDWKKLPNDPLQTDETTHEYSPPEQVQIEMEKLLALHQKHNDQDVNPVVKAAFLHHRFTQIHPFQDGNGRIARALASLVLIKDGYFLFVVKDEERVAYLNALEDADRGDLMVFVSFIAEKQKDLLYQALRKAQDVDLGKRLNAIKEEAQDDYHALEKNKPLYEKANGILSDLVKIAEDLIKKFKKVLEDSPSYRDGSSDEHNGAISDEINVDISVPEGMELLPTTDLYTIEIPNPDKDFLPLRLYLGVLGKNNIPEKIFCAFEYAWAVRISSLQLDLDTDIRRSGLRFRNWLQDQFTEVWLDDLET